VSVAVPEINEVYMEIPVIPDNVYESLVNNVENGFPWGLESKANEAVKKGIMTMELVLDIEDGNNFRGRVMKDRKAQLLKDSLKDNDPEFHKKVMRFRNLAVAFFVIAVVCIMFASITPSFINNIPQTVLMIIYVFGLIILPIAALVMYIIHRILLGKAKKTGDIKLDYENRVANYNTWTLLDDCTEYGYFDFESDLEQICDKLGIHPDEMKMNFGKVKGGGSTWMGWGGIGAVGLGLGLTAMSKLKAAHDNKKVNERIRQIENWYYFNNVAYYVNNLEGIAEITQDSPKEILQNDLV
jgi:hypothetical protein